MDVSIQTGHTKATTGVSLVALSFESELGEHACLLLQIEASPKDAKTLEEECTIIVKQALLDSHGDAWSRLDGTLKELNSLFKGLLVAESVDNVHAILSITDASGALHVSHAGRAEAYLIRGGSASQITEFSRGKPSPSFIHISSGQLEPRDAVLFSTQRILRTVTPAQLAQLAQRGDQLLDEVMIKLEAEHETASLGTLHVPARRGVATEAVTARPALSSRRSGRGRSASRSFLPNLAVLKSL